MFIPADSSLHSSYGYIEAQYNPAYTTLEQLGKLSVDILDEKVVLFPGIPKSSSISIYPSSKSVLAFPP